MRASPPLIAEHDPSVFGGYSGCVSENGLMPCAQDGFEGMGGMTALKKPLVWDETTGTCLDTGYTAETETYWILWGHPQDTYELTSRTGMTPVVTFPLVRGPYPSYKADHGDDAADLYPKIKEWLAYLGAFTEEELVNYDVEASEGAEAGVAVQIAAMAARIAQTSCNRDIKIFMEAPAYGYDLGYSASLAEKIGGFLDGCSSGDTISISAVGWLPGTALPEATGADGVTYTPDSTDPNSPWMESLVFPENPSGVIKTPQGPAGRRVCDACYIYPMYFGMNGYEVPEAPDCMSWAGSVTKLYSASVRAGYILYKNDDADWVSLMESGSSSMRSLADGHMSEWTWWGQIQILDQLMLKPYTDPTSWIGAYVGLMNEKWTAIIDGFSGCGSYIELTNPYAGAYGWFMLKGDAMGKESSFVSSFFTDVLGVKTTTYYWGFRGSDPADYYGAGYTTYDFIRLQLFRDVSVYQEVGRRAALVCADPATASVDGYMTINEWIASSTRRRALQDAPLDHAAHVRGVAPRLAEDHVQRLAASMAADDAIGAAVEKNCAPAYTSTCLQKHSSEKPTILPTSKPHPTLRKLSAAKPTGAGKVSKSKARELPSTAVASVAPKRVSRKLEHDSTMDIGDCVAQMMSAYPYSPCPAESFYWEHDPSVFGGYSGCVSENGLMPCAQDGFEGMGGMTALKKPLVWDETTGTCLDTGYTAETETYWILWGHPQDTYELTSRTGMTPVVTFPLVRGPYPSYKADHGDDAADLYPKIKEWLAYLGAFTEEELVNYDVEASEGAEAGVAVQIAAMAARIAQTSCNRDIKIFMEAPAYGYDLGYSASLAEKIGGFLDGCSSGDTISISAVGWLPGTALPEATGADGVTYTPDSTDPNSPWMESLVFPENPSGVIKTPQGPAGRRVCDACYIYPMYFGMNGYEVPEAPDCMSWAGSVTKLYSASVRAGYILYKNDDADWVSLMESGSSSMRSLADGHMSEWTWWGQIQILDQLMLKPYTDPTSWIGAYVGLMNEKWTAIIDGFSGCGSYIELTNPYAGAYGWFMLKGDAMGKESSFVSSFFTDVLGVKTTTYYWGFRGSDPADYYGAGYTTYDFIRLQLFRDVSVYQEVGRRAALVCADPATASVDGYMTINEWIASSTRRRALQDAPLDHAAHVRGVAPRLAEDHVQRLAASMAADDAIGAAVEKNCAPAYTSTCLQKHSSEKRGTRSKSSVLALD